MSEQPLEPTDVPFLTTDQMREVDRLMIDDYRITLFQMMENAGRALARLARSRFLSGDAKGKRALVLVGSGGNGGGGMASMDFGDYQSMVEDTPIDTMIVEFHDGDGKLFGASLTDCLSDGLSGVYKFFEPSEPQRSAGTYIVLWHIERARELGLSYVYLGYWIAGCGKMSYKARFRPIEALGPNGWRLMDSDNR